MHTVLKVGIGIHDEDIVIILSVERGPPSTSSFKLDTCSRLRAYDCLAMNKKIGQRTSNFERLDGRAVPLAGHDPLIHLIICEDAAICTCIMQVMFVLEARKDVPL